MDVSYPGRFVPKTIHTQVGRFVPSGLDVSYAKFGRFVPKGWTFRTQWFFYFIFCAWFGIFASKSVKFIQPIDCWSIRNPFIFWKDQINYRNNNKNKNKKTSGTNSPALKYESSRLWVRNVQTSGYETCWVRNVQGTKRPAPPERYISSRPCGINKNDNPWFLTVELSVLGKMLFIGHNFWTVRNMMTKLHKYVYLIKTMCCEQDGQLWLSWFMIHLPLIKIVSWP